LLRLQEEEQRGIAEKLVLDWRKQQQARAAVRHANYWPGHY
jgi:hypothetical protein